MESTREGTREDVGRMWPSGWRMDAACTWAQYLSSLLCQPVVLTVLEAGSGLVKWESGRKGLEREKERGRDSVRWRGGRACILVRYCSSGSISTFGQEALTVAVVRTPPPPPPLKEQRHTPYRSRWDQTVEGRVPREMYVWVSKGGGRQAREASQSCKDALKPTKRRTLGRETKRRDRCAIPSHYLEGGCTTS